MLKHGEVGAFHPLAQVSETILVPTHDLFNPAPLSLVAIHLSTFSEIIVSVLSGRLFFSFLFSPHLVLGRRTTPLN